MAGAVVAAMQGNDAVAMSELGPPFAGLAGFKAEDRGVKSDRAWHVGGHEDEFDGLWRDGGRGHGGNLMGYCADSTWKAEVVLGKKAVG